MKLNECCIINKLEKIAEIYHSNTDDFILYKCNECDKYWLHHINEENWLDNLAFKFNEYIEWYIGIYEKDLSNVYEKKFDDIVDFHGFIFKDTTNFGKKEMWRKYK